MAWLFWIAMLCLVGPIFFLLLREPWTVPARDPIQLPSLSRNLFNLEIGDIVQYMAIDWAVEGKLLYNEDGFTWIEYMLQDGDRIRWLSVAEDDIVEVAWLETIDTQAIGQNPPLQLTFNSKSYRRIESGVAIMQRVGTIRKRQAERCRYFDYKGPDDSVLSIEDWDGDIEVSLGERIHPAALSLLPGSGQSIYQGNG